MPLRESIATRVVDAGGRLTVRSALNPVLWLCAIVTAPLLLSVAILRDAPAWLVVIGCAPVITALFGFLFLLFFDRDKLQSEEYQLRKRSLELIEQKGDHAILADRSIEVIPNPDSSLPDENDRGAS